MIQDAVISPCGLFRYVLTRRWGDGPYMLFIMLNPSTADARFNDPTIRRCIEFAKREGFGGLVVVNLYAFRATKPAVLENTLDRVGPMNQAYLIDWATRPECGKIVVAWGAHPIAKQRRIVPEMLIWMGCELHCLGTTKHGQPRHPLYLRGNQPLERWNPPDA